MEQNVLVIGIAGGTACGKTTVTKKIKEYFSDDVTVMFHDNYYKHQENMTYDQRSQLNYDHPNAFDTDLLIEHLITLKNGDTIQCPVYDYTIHNRTEETLTITPTKVIIVEGILIFTQPELTDLMDIRIFVDTDADTRILRRILRDVNERERTLESVVLQYLTTVKPMHDQYVQPSRKNAHIVMLDGGHNIVALDMITHRIKDHIKTTE